MFSKQVITIAYTIKGHSLEHRLSPPIHLQTNRIIKRFSRRIEDTLQNHHVYSDKELEITLH